MRKKKVPPADGLDADGLNRDSAGFDAPRGDWRGPYGYGHRAYRPDPKASYVFQPGPPRTLPEKAEPEPEIIWKRPLR